MTKRTLSSGVYKETTHSIEVTVEPEYLEEQSSQKEGYYVWAYHINIRNLGKDSVQLLHRYWKITDAKGHVEEVRGPGVVGEQPVLRHNESFSYTSGTYLSTPSGMMVGTYEMEKENGEMVNVAIPYFSLDIPGQVILPH